MKKIIYSAVLFLSAVAAIQAQNITFGSYVTSNNPHGQLSLRHQFVDNVLYAATSRFSVTCPGHTESQLAALFNGVYDQAALTIPVNGSKTITIDLTAKGGAALTYPGGEVYLHFYSNRVPATVSGRVQLNTGTWNDIVNWTNIASNTSSYSVLRGTVPQNTYATKIEITWNAGASVECWPAQVEYIMGRVGQYEEGIVTKLREHTLYNNLSWNDNTNALAVKIQPTGAAYFKGNVGIGTTTPQAKLAVNGDIFAKKVRVTQTGWPDYVFADGYQLPSLQEIETFIKQHKHLPGVKAAAEVETNGLDLGENQAALLEKIEQLTLHVIQINKTVEQQQKLIQEQQRQISRLQTAKKKNKK